MFGRSNEMRRRRFAHTLHFSQSVDSVRFGTVWRLFPLGVWQTVMQIALQRRPLSISLLCLVMAGCVQFPVDSGSGAVESNKPNASPELGKVKSNRSGADTAQDPVSLSAGVDKNSLAAHLARGKKRREAGDYSGAAKAFEPAAIAGDPVAQVAIGDLYLYGKGVEQSYVKAHGWYVKAVKLGNAQAQHMLGVLYSNGWGVKRDSNLAMSWFEQSAQQGWAPGQYQLGLLLLNAQTDPAQMADGLQWIRKAAMQGLAEAGFVLASSIERGKGTSPSSIYDAMHWYREAAERGHAPGQFALAEIYLQGRPQVPRDLGEALKWFTRAADQGHVVAQSNLATMHRYGMGTPINLVEAFKWYSLAAANSEVKDAGVQQAAALAREKIAARMDPEQRAEGKRRVLLWLETHQIKGATPSSSAAIVPVNNSTSGSSGSATIK